MDPNRIHLPPRPNGPEPHAPQPEVTLQNRYRLLEQVGKGAMGLVWKAYDKNLKMSVALKFLPPESLHDPGDRSRFIETCHKIKSVSSRHLCRFNDFFEDPIYGPYLVMQYIQGTNLHEFLHRKPLRSPQLALEILRRVAVGVDDLHSFQVIHCDLKPSNIMLVANESAVTELWVVDFGLATHFHRMTASSRGNAGVWSHQQTGGGTLPYMAPEQILDRPLSPQTDIYAIGCIAYELLSGKPPFGLDTRILRECQLNSEPPPIDGMSKEVNAVLRKSLAKNPANRFDSCNAFVTFLTDAFNAPHSSHSGSQPPRSLDGSTNVPQPSPPSENFATPAPPGSPPPLKSHRKSTIKVPWLGQPPALPPASTQSSVANTIPTALPSSRSGSIPPGSNAGFAHPVQPVGIAMPTSNVIANLNQSFQLTTWLIVETVAAAGCMLGLFVVLCGTAILQSSLNTGTITLGLGMISYWIGSLFMIIFGLIFAATAWGSLPRSDPRCPAITAVMLLCTPGYNFYWIPKFYQTLEMQLDAVDVRPPGASPLYLVWLRVIELIFSMGCFCLWLMRDLMFSSSQLTGHGIVTIVFVISAFVTTLLHLAVHWQVVRGFKRLRKSHFIES